MTNFECIKCKKLQELDLPPIDNVFRCECGSELISYIELKKVTDKLGIEWELFVDESCWYSFCVSCIDDKFNKRINFRFGTYSKAEQFMKLLEDRM